MCISGVWMRIGSALDGIPSAQGGHGLLQLLGAEMPVDQHVRAVLELAQEDGTDDAHLGQQTPQGRALTVRVQPPVPGVRPDQRRVNPAELLDSVSKQHGGKPSLGSL